MNYYLYKILVFFIRPGLWLMRLNLLPFQKLVFPYMPDYIVAMKLLFPNKYVFEFVLAQSKLESGAVKKGWNATSYNLFNISAKASKYKKSYYDTKKAGEPILATYSNYYDAVYDYYWYVSVYKPNEYKAMVAFIPDIPFDRISNVTTIYIGQVLAEFKRYGYFTADLSLYIQNIAKIVRNQYDWDKPYSVIKYYCFFFWVVVLTTLVYLIKKIKDVKNFFK